MRKGMLTQQQRVVLSLVATGMDNKAVAEALVISRRTVDAHMRNTMSALEVSTRTAAVVLALHHGEIDMKSVVDAIQKGTQKPGTG